MFAVRRLPVGDMPFVCRAGRAGCEVGVGLFLPDISGRLMRLHGQACKHLTVGLGASCAPVWEHEKGDLPKQAALSWKWVNLEVSTLPRIRDY